MRVTNAAPKPPAGSPCNGCGACCLAETCAIGTDLLGYASPCPALEADGGRYWCGLVSNPSKYLASHFPEADRLALDEFLGGMIEQALGVGRGCDSSDDA